MQEAAAHERNGQAVRHVRDNRFDVSSRLIRSRASAHTAWYVRATNTAKRADVTARTKKVLTHTVNVENLVRVHRAKHTVSTRDIIASMFLDFPKSC